MPIIQQTNPLAGMIALALGGYGVANRMKQQKQEQDRQKSIDTQNAALAQSELQNRQANTAATQQKTAEEAQLFPIQERQAGVNPANGQPFNYGVTPQQFQKATSSHNAQDLVAFYNTMAARAFSEGAVDQAGKFAALAGQYQTQSVKQQTEALDFQKFAEKQIQDAAQRSRWSGQTQAELARVGVEAARVQNEISHGAMTLQQGQERIQLELQNLHLRQQEYDLGVRKENFEESKKPTGSKALPPIQSQIDAAHKAGITDANVIAQKLIEAGYSQVQIRGALWGFQGKPLP